jgi:glutamate-1-semialdehyde 2,1-aminomutase
MSSAGTTYPDDNSRSAALYQRARQVLPGGTTRATVALSPYPVYAHAGSGYTLTDADGVSRIDFFNNATSLVHGHAHPDIVAAVIEQVQRGSAFANPTEAEIALAELLCGRVPGFERVRFTNSGTEAVMNAVKAARAFTGRHRIAKAEGVYHGSYDYLEVSLDPPPETWGEPLPAPVAYAGGTPPGVLADVAVLPHNDAQGAAEALAGEDALACIVVDPMPSRCGMEPITAEFLEVLQAHCRRTGALLVFDEVITFRVGPAGMQGVLGVTPDLTALGKIIGGGFPVGAVAGRADVMAVFDAAGGKARLPHAGTYNGNPVTAVAGRKAMELLSDEAFARLNDLGDYARRTLGAVFREAGVPGHVAGAGSLFLLRFDDGPADYRALYPTPELQARRLHLTHHFLNHGIMMNPMGLGAISTPMAQAQVDRLAEVLAEGLRAAPPLMAPQA